MGTDSVTLLLMRRLVLIFVLASAAGLGCESSKRSENTERTERTAEDFYCYKVPQHGNPERECGVKPLSQCGSDACLRQPHAYCFYDEGHMNLTGDPSPQWICVATEKECESWRADVTAKRKAGPCLSLTPSELSTKP